MARAPGWPGRLVGQARLAMAGWPGLAGAGSGAGARLAMAGWPGLAGAGSGAGARLAMAGWPGLA
ncbi:MAG: hypothetical protein ACRDY0_04910, partial [Acidimicrobiales bacterium]